MSREMKKKAIKAGQYYAAQYNGDNGDLIVGKVKSVRTTGEVLLENLLSGKISTKKADVLCRRNKRISKAQADELVELYQTPSSKAEVRRRAVVMEPFTNGGEKLPAQSKISIEVEKESGNLLISYINDLRAFIDKRTNRFLMAVVNLLEKRGGQV